VAERFLKETEEATGAWDAKGHVAQLAQVLVPRLGADALAAGFDIIQDFAQAVQFVRRKKDSASSRVNVPAKHLLFGRPNTIALTQLLLRNWFLTVGIISGKERAKDLIQHVEQEAADKVAPALVALTSPNQVIHINILPSHRFLEVLAGRCSRNSSDWGC